MERGSWSSPSYRDAVPTLEVESLRIAELDHAAIDLTVCETPTACAGAVASYVLKRIAYRAGTYAPHIQDAIFDELHTAEHGASVAHVDRWIVRRSPALQALGYRLDHHRTNSGASELVEWLRAGRGHRAAVLATSYDVLHPGAKLGDAITHAVGLATEGCEGGGDGRLVVIDPWPKHGRAPDDFGPALEHAHRAGGGVALAIHWVGWR